MGSEALRWCAPEVAFGVDVAGIGQLATMADVVLEVLDKVCVWVVGYNHGSGAT